MSCYYYKDVVLTLLREAMLKHKEAKGFLIDGYPRELEQGTKFEAEVSGHTFVKLMALILRFVATCANIETLFVICLLNNRSVSKLQPSFTT